MTPAPAAQQPLSTSLRPVHVGLREDLEVSRHVFRGVPSYVIRDPMTFQSQRLGAAEYEVFVAIQAERSLGDAFADLIARGRLSNEDEEHFYEFVVRLHRLGFLQLPISDEKLLYQRYQARQRGKRREKLMGFLFLRLPLWNPDAFLNRTIAVGRVLFHPLFFAGWVVLMLAAGFVAASRWQDLSQPLNGLLVTQNLPLLWTTLIVLKAFHEMGHAYACKHYGGHVPETGAYLILFTPCAYMDATAAWGFPKRRHRLFVSLGGMYIESLIAAVALFIWATTEPSLLNSLAYNVVFLAGVTTVLFNINPLMRYDGYYILSDWVEVPNLRQRAVQHVSAKFKRWFLAIDAAGGEATGRLGWVLMAFGVGSTLYRFALLFALAAVLASKVLVLGVVLGFAYLAMTLYSSLRRLATYLWHSAETAPVRGRAVAMSVVLLFIAPLIILGIPAPSRVQAAATLARERECVVRAAADGFVAEVNVEEGRIVDAGAAMIRLTSDSRIEEIARASVGLRAAEIRRDAFRSVDPSRAAQQDAEVRRLQGTLTIRRSELVELEHRAPIAGHITQCLRPTDAGRFVREGTPLATVSDGPWQVRGLLTESEVVRAAAKIGDEASFRTANDPTRTLTGRILRIAPLGSRSVEFPELTQLGGGDVAVDPTSHAAAIPYFVVTVELDDSLDVQLFDGMTGQIRLQASAEPLGASLLRRAGRFFDQVLIQ